MNQKAAELHRTILECNLGKFQQRWHIVQMPSESTLPWSWIAASAPAESTEPTVTISFNIPSTRDKRVERPQEILLLDLDMPTIAPLPFSSREVEKLADHLSSINLKTRRIRSEGMDAENLLAEISRSSITHIVGHANPAAFGHLYQGLWYESQGKANLLTLPEIAMQTTSSELVVLSACGTDAKPFDGRGKWNLAEAFIAAGSQRVIASANSLSDSAAPLWTQTFHSTLWRTGDPAIAARDARAVLRRSPYFRHPKFWAGIDLFVSGKSDAPLQ